eukprot:4677965-Pleurochrysis_carterae.AAC.2
MCNRGKPQPLCLRTADLQACYTHTRAPLATCTYARLLLLLVPTRASRRHSLRRRPRFHRVARARAFRHVRCTHTWAARCKERPVFFAYAKPRTRDGSRRGRARAAAKARRAEAPRAEKDSAWTGAACPFHSRCGGTCTPLAARSLHASSVGPLTHAWLSTRLLRALFLPLRFSRRPPERGRRHPRPPCAREPSSQRTLSFFCRSRGP